jgi:hypothetical protein
VIAAVRISHFKTRSFIFFTFPRLNCHRGVLKFKPLRVVGALGALLKNLVPEVLKKDLLSGKAG